MKFTKEEAYKELVSRMTAKGEKLNLSERSINEQLDTLMPLIADDETEIADFITKILPLVKTADANIRNDVSTQIRDYEKNHQGQNQKQTQEPKPTSKEDKSDLDLLKEKIAALEADAAKSKSEKNKADKLTQLRSYMKGKGVKDEDFMNGILGELNITEDFDVEAKGNTLVNLYNKISANNIGGGTTPQNAGNGNIGDKALADIVERAGKMNKALSLNEN